MKSINGSFEILMLSIGENIIFFNPRMFRPLVLNVIER